MAHPLTAWLEAKKITQDELSERSGVERSTITKVLSGKRKRFSPEAAKAISKATRGEVTIEQLLYTTPRSAAA